MIKIGKLLTIGLWGVMLISAILIISMMVNISSNDLDPTMNSWINTNMVWTFILLIAVAGIAVLAAIFQTVTDISAAKKGLLTLGVFLVIAIISYLLASDTMPSFLGVDKFIENGTLTPRVSKLIDTGLNATYILFIVAILSLALAPLMRLFDK